MADGKDIGNRQCTWAIGNGNLQRTIEVGNRTVETHRLLGFPSSIADSYRPLPIPLAIADFHRPSPMCLPSAIAGYPITRFRRTGV